ncbi:c-type cytochrome [Enterovibrio sp. 27052020O]|uniref:c-type cytochrome n=1 Tax=Enterovibrio sp. 27052020O TaxID=3241166 RepID=UPI00388D5408
MNRYLGGVFFLAFIATPALANMPKGDSQKGALKAYTCQFCHGETGVSPRDDYPNMNGQNAQYLYDSMTAYKKGDRGGAMGKLMQQQMSVLNEQDMADIAEYYAKQATQ